MPSTVRPESYPPLRDYYGDDLRPAPDGHPWRKACPTCLYRKSDPQDVGPHQGDAILSESPDNGVVFYCVHRTDESDEHRVCACYAALQASRGVAPENHKEK